MPLVMKATDVVLSLVQWVLTIDRLLPQIARGRSPRTTSAAAPLPTASASVSVTNLAKPKLDSSLRHLGGCAC